MSNKKEIKLNNSAMRKLYYIFNDKERKKIFNEVSFYKDIYNAVDDDKLIYAVIDKNLKTKIHKVIFLDDKDKIKEYNECFKLYREFRDFEEYIK